MGSVVSKYDRIIREESMQLRDSRDIRQIYDDFLLDDPAVALQLSVQIKESRRQYYRMFETAEAEINKGDMTPFVLGFLAFICQSIQHKTEELQEKKAVLSAGMRKLDSLGLEKGTTEELAILLLQVAIFSETGLSLDELARAMHSTRVTISRHLKTILDRFITVTQEGRKKLCQLNLFGQEQVRD